MTKRLLLIGVLAVTGIAYGQTACPVGVPIGDPRCGPSPSWPISSPQPEGPQWQLTWGAIAADSTTGDIGTSAGKLSKREAKREAIARCAATGSRNCKLQLAYHNQCAAIAGPSEDGIIVSGTTIFQGGSTIELAAQLALSACMAKRDGGACSVDFAECTTPILVN